MTRGAGPYARPVALGVALVVLVAAAGVAGYGDVGPRDDPAPGAPPGDRPDDAPDGGVDLAACLRGGPEVEERPAKASTRAEIAAIARDVERLRGLRFEEPVRKALLPPERANRRLRRAIGTPGATARAAERILEVLGQVEPGTDLFGVVRRFTLGQVLGVYFPRRDELVVKAGGGPLSPLARATLAHELEHALADQAFGLPREGGGLARADRAAAAEALVEGDATLTGQRWAVRVLSFADQGALANDPIVRDASEASAGVPAYVRMASEFPYRDGLAFVCSLYERGGWRAVDRAYERPPETTAQVLWPDRYHRRAGAEWVRVDGRPAGGWRRGPLVEVGAADLVWLFAAPGGDRGAALDDPRGAARPWRGGALRLWTKGRASALGMTIAARGPLCGSVTAWYAASRPGRAAAPRRGEAAAFDGARYDAVVRCPAGRVHLGVAPSLRDARRLAR
ncbi:MAG TPA: hypothetical protein VHJ34_13155 [Actinomycetota bacterium]|nr:hypothetical protein [Actinomycetota bacterium]